LFHWPINPFQSKVKLTFYERKLQILEVEKFEEWKNHRPLERILEIGELSLSTRYCTLDYFGVINDFQWCFTDCPMSSGIHNIVSEGNQSNSYDFEWNPSNETKLYIIVSKQRFCFIKLCHAW